MNLDGPVRASQTAGIGNAKVTIAFDNWKDGAVAATQHEIPVVAPRSLNLKLEAVSSRLKGELIHPNKAAWLLNLKFSPDGKRIIAGDYSGGGIAVWDVFSGKQLAMIETGYHAFFAVSPDWRSVFAPRLKTRKYERVEQNGKQMFRWIFDGDVRAWSLDDGQLLRTYKHKPPRGISGMQLSPDGTRFLTHENVPGIYDIFYKGSASLWDVKSGEYRILDGRQSFDKFSPDGRYFASSLSHEKENYARARKLIDVTTGKEKWSIPITDKNVTVGVYAFSRHGRVLFGWLQVFDRPNKWDHWRSWMKWWDAATGREIASFEGDRDDGSLYARVSPDGQFLAAVNYKGDKRKLFLYSIAEKQLLRTVLLGEKTAGYEPVAGAPAFHPDGKWLAVVTRRYPEKTSGANLDPRDLPQPRILLIEAATGAIRETMVAPQGLSSTACFGPDGRTLATDGHGRVLLWDMTKMPQ